jgi:hypothetical protein
MTETLVEARAIGWCLIRMICVILEERRNVRGVEAGAQSMIGGTMRGESIMTRDGIDGIITTTIGIETGTETDIAMNKGIEDETDKFGAAA